MRTSSATFEAKMNEPATVFVVHQDPYVLESVRVLTKFMQVLCRSFLAFKDFLQEANDRSHGCLLAGAQAAGGNGVDLLDELRSRRAPLPVIMTSPRPDPALENKALRKGAIDFLVNPDRTMLEATIRRGIEAAETLWRKRRLREQARRECDEIQRKCDRLTDGGRAVLDLVLQGELNKKVARIVDISVRTVEQRRRNIMLKMEVDSLPQLVRQMTKLQIVEDFLGTALSLHPA